MNFIELIHVLSSAESIMLCNRSRLPLLLNQVKVICCCQEEMGYCTDPHVVSGSCLGKLLHQLLVSRG